MIQKKINEFYITFFKRHPIIKDCENIILIDTGTPSTIHSSCNLTFSSYNYNVSKNFMGLTVSKISDMIGTEITTLLEANILSNYNILFDYENETVVFDKQEISFYGIETDITNIMGIPIIELSI